MLHWAVYMMKLKLALKLALRNIHPATATKPRYLHARWIDRNTQNTGNNQEGTIQNLQRK